MIGVWLDRWFPRCPFCASRLCDARSHCERHGEWIDKFLGCGLCYAEDVARADEQRRREVAEAENRLADKIAERVAARTAIGRDGVRVPGEVGDE